MARVMVAMSGGVDSSVAAVLLREQGHEVMGVTMRLWTQTNPELPTYHQRCCSVEAVDDARRVCQILGIPFYVLNLEKEFQTWVVDYFCSEYARGRTPNPCLACNEHIKFRLLWQRSLTLGADYLATGHYACIDQAEGRYCLLKGIDKAKDQSYALYTLGQKELAHLLFPVGCYTKEQVRRLALEHGLPVADKLDSQEICFIPDDDYRRFVQDRVPTTPGDIVDKEGHVLGIHAGTAFYTIGQRRGLGLASPEPLYVTSLDVERNQVVVGPRRELLRDSLQADDLHFVAGEIPQESFTAAVKIRYRSPEAKTTIRVEDGMAHVHFFHPQYALTPGQAAVFYQGEEVLGGGTII